MGGNDKRLVLILWVVDSPHPRLQRFGTNPSAVCGCTD